MDRPIIFSAPMIRALLDGRKTMTRRLIKTYEGKVGPGVTIVHAQHPDHPDTPDFMRSVVAQFKPPYAVGDRLWVREAVGNLLLPSETTDGIGRAWYRATSEWANDDRVKWRPSIHMPRWASRLTLTVTGVKVERLQEISEADCDAEVFAGDFPHKVLPELFPDADKAGHLTLPECFARLWNSLHGPDAWAANPWVVAVSFTVAKRNIDAEEPAP